MCDAASKKIRLSVEDFFVCSGSTDPDRSSAWLERANRPCEVLELDLSGFPLIGSWPGYATFPPAMAWQNIVCDLVGVALLCLGILGKNVQFRQRHSGVPIPNSLGRLFAIAVGACFLLAGLLVRAWR